MIIVVNDACLIIDMLKINLSDQFFRLPFDMHTTDLVESEITDENAERFKHYVDNQSIQIHGLSSEKWVEVQNIFSKNLSSLSLADCSCLWLCQNLSATLLTSDGKLKKTAIDNSVPVHGILWVFEQLINFEIINKSEASNKLMDLMEINPRLPHKECQKLLQKWKYK